MKKQKKQLIMLNLGCGYTGHDDWINIDYGVLALINKFTFLKKIIFGLGIVPKTYNKKWPKNLRFINLRMEFPFADKSVDHIFTAHFIEHLDKHESVKLFKECYRSLKKGGTIRILVPDLDIIVDHYKKDQNSLHKVDVLNNHFWGVLPKQDTPPSLHTRILSFFARGHNWLYNYEYMKKILVLSGFSDKNIVRCKFQQGKTPNIDYLDNHPDHSLIVEATK